MIALPLRMDPSQSLLYFMDKGNRNTESLSGLRKGIPRSAHRHDVWNLLIREFTGWMVIAASCAPAIRILAPRIFGSGNPIKVAGVIVEPVAVPMINRSLLEPSCHKSLGYEPVSEEFFPNTSNPQADDSISISSDILGENFAFPKLVWLASALGRRQIIQSSRSPIRGNFKAVGKPLNGSPDFVVHGRTVGENCNGSKR